MFTYKLDWKSCRKVADITSYQAGIHWDDREDFVQDVLVEMAERARQDSGGLSTKEMWRAYKKARGILSLNAPVRDTTIDLSETIADDKALDLDPTSTVMVRFEREKRG